MFRDVIYFSLGFVATLNKRAYYEYKTHRRRYLFIILSHLLLMAVCLPTCLYFTLLPSCKSMDLALMKAFAPNRWVRLVLELMPWFREDLYYRGVCGWAQTLLTENPIDLVFFFTMVIALVLIFPIIVFSLFYVPHDCFHCLGKDPDRRYSIF